MKQSFNAIIFTTHATKHKIYAPIGIKRKNPKSKKKGRGLLAESIHEKNNNNSIVVVIIKKKV